MTDLIKLYNPANAGTLSQEDLDQLQKLDSAQIKELAHAYPNSATQRAYLLIVDNRKPVDKQLPSLSTYENLWNLREKNGQRFWVAWGFKGAYKPKPVTNVRAKKSEVLDLSDVELMSLPGFKKSGGVKEVINVPIDSFEQVPIRKIRKKAEFEALPVADKTETSKATKKTKSK